MTVLIGIRQATGDLDQGDVVFTRRDQETGREYTIYGHRHSEGRSQWGAETRILGDNVDDLERWARGELIHVEEDL